MDSRASLEVPEPRASASVWKAVAVLALVVGLFLRESLFGGQILSQIDVLPSFQPWSESAAEDYQPSNRLLLDQSELTQPFLHFFAQRLAEGELPLWNPHNYGGHPVAAGPTGALFWPPHWAYFAFPSWGFYAWHAFARLLFIGLFTWLFMRRLGLSDLCSMQAAVAFCLCGFNVLWLGHPHTNVSLFLPFLLWCVERTAADPSAKNGALTGAGVGFAVLGGHLQTALHVFLIVLAWAIARSFSARLGSKLGPAGLRALAIGAGCGLLLAAPQWIPFAEYMGDSQGRAVSRTEQLVSDVPLPQAAKFMLAPRSFGAPDTHDYVGPEGNHLNFQELAGGFVGSWALILAVVGICFQRRLRAVSAVVGIGVALCLAVAWQIEPIHAMARAVPGLGSTKLMRFLMPAAFGLAVLSALGLQALLAGDRLPRRLRAVIGSASILLTAGQLFVFGYTYNPSIARDDPHFLPRTSITDYLASTPSPGRVIGVDGTAFAPNANLFYPGVDLLTGYDGIEQRAMAELIGLLTSDERAELYVREIRWFDKWIPLASALNLRYVLSDKPLPAPLELVLDGKLLLYENPAVLPRAFAAEDVRVVTNPKQRLQILGAEDFNPTTALLERESESPHYRSWLKQPTQAEMDRVRLVDYEPRDVSIEVERQAPGLIVLSDAWDPGWSATVNGQPAPIERVDHALRGVWVPGGQSRIEMHYGPQSMRWGLILGALGAIGLIFMASRRRSSTRGAPTPDES